MFASKDTALTDANPEGAEVAGIQRNAGAAGEPGRRICFRATCRFFVASLPSTSLRTSFRNDILRFEKTHYRIPGFLLRRLLPGLV